MIDTKNMSTEALERNLRDKSEQIESDKVLFHQISEELKLRRSIGDEQPRQMTDDERRAAALVRANELDTNLVLKITAMEAEQAKLTLELGAALFAQHQAEERLALTCKHYKVAFSAAIAAARVHKPLSWDEARELLLNMIKNTKPDNAFVEDWMIFALIEASK